MNRIYILVSVAALSILFFSFKRKDAKLLIGGSGWNKIAIIDKGKIFTEGTPQQLIAETKNATTLEDVFISLTGKELRDDL